MSSNATQQAPTPASEAPPRRRFTDLADNCFRDTHLKILRADGVWCFREYTPTLNRGNRLEHAECVALAKDCQLAGGGWERADTHAWDALIDRTREDPALNPEIADRIENGWHWAEEDPSSSGNAWFVGLGAGRVSWYDRGYYGFVVGSRLVPAGQ